MFYKGLKSAYYQRQQSRVESARLKISQSELNSGRIIPDTEDLRVHEGRSLPVTIGYIDISKFSSRASALSKDQALLFRALALFFSEMVHIIHDYDGEVEKNTGDGLMFYFSDSSTPATHSVEKALSASLTMFTANDSFITPILKNSSIPPIEFRISMDYGPVIIGNLGATKKFNSRVAVGSAANFAAKMLSHAGPQEIVLGASANAHIPEGWRQYSLVTPIVTGWTFAQDSTAYPLYKYIGRWSRLIS